MIPPSLQAEIIDELHTSRPGIARMKSLALLHVWWPGIDSQIEKAVRDCTGCQHNRQGPMPAPLHL